MIKKNIEGIKSALPDAVTLVAVSKTKPIADLMEAYDAGQRIFGENHALEMREKYESLPKDIEWHFIGHLQTNKIKYIIPFVHLIHAVDSEKLLIAIDKEASKQGRVVDCLLQFHIATEDTKYGLDYDEAVTMLTSEHFAKLEHIRLCGVMGMATFCDDEKLIRKEFSTLKTIFTKIKETFFAHADYFCEISMGMSDDYHIAIEEGSTMIRVGSSIFGHRNYNKSIL